MGFLRRLFGGGRDQPSSVYTESTGSEIRISVSGGPAEPRRPAQPGRKAPRPVDGNFTPPELPHLRPADLLPKAERPYHSTSCPYCGVALSPLPKAKKACPGCHATILVRSGSDGYIYLLREADVDAWTEDDNRKQGAALQLFETKEREALRNAGFLVSESGMTVEVHGESHYQRALERAAGGRSDHGAHFQCAARLIREPTNRYDPNAVRVEVQGQTVGYVSRDDVEEIQPMLQKLDAAGRPAWVRATIVGGWDDGQTRGSFGIEIDDLPDENEV